MHYIRLFLNEHVFHSLAWNSVGLQFFKKVKLFCLQLIWNKWYCNMGFNTMLNPPPSKARQRIKKRRNRSASPKRTRSGKSGRNSIATDISCHYPIENKIKRSSRHASPQHSNRHRKHTKVTPSRKKVNSYHIVSICS